MIVFSLKSQIHMKHWWVKYEVVYICQTNNDLKSLLVCFEEDIMEISELMIQFL